MFRTEVHSRGRQSPLERRYRVAARIFNSAVRGLACRRLVLVHRLAYNGDGVAFKMGRDGALAGVLRLVCALQLFSVIEAAGQAPIQDAAQTFRRALAVKVQSLEKENAAAIAEVNGWLFLTSELRFLSVNRF
jgi:hypothetical protein